MENVIKVKKSSKYIFAWFGNSGEKGNFTDNIGGNKICNTKFEKLEAIIFDNRLSFNSFTETATATPSYVNYDKSYRILNWH